MLLCNPQPVLDLNDLMLLLQPNQTSALANNRWFVKEDNAREDLPLKPQHHCTGGPVLIIL